MDDEIRSHLSDVVRHEAAEADEADRRAEEFEDMGRAWREKAIAHRATAQKFQAHIGEIPAVRRRVTTGGGQWLG